MQVPYEFRGRRLDNNEYVYGDLVQGVFTKIRTPNGEYFVDPYTVFKLVGYDKDNNEVYRGKNYGR